MGAKGQTGSKEDFRRVRNLRKPYSVPQTAALPDFRVREVPAFSKIGVDFCGPVYIKATAERTNKAYIVLFSCCVTRAIYLELVGDMSAEALTRAPRRFTARRGTHTLIAHSWNSRRDWVCPPKTIPESNAKMLILLFYVLKRCFMGSLLINSVAHKLLPLT